MIHLRQIIVNCIFVLSVVFFGALSLVSLICARRGIIELNDQNINATDFESQINSAFFLRNVFLETQGAIANITFQPQLNGITKLNNDYLTATRKPGDEYDAYIFQNAKSLSELNDYLKNKGITFLYVQAPYKIDKYDNQLPTGIYDDTNRNIDMFLSELDAYGIEYIDIRQELYNEGMSTYDVFYKTDHHWNIYGGFFAFTRIEEYISNRLKVDVPEEITNVNSYFVETYKDSYLGYRGRQASKTYAGLDDFDLLFPNFKTHLICEQQDGTYNEICLDYERIGDLKSFYNVYAGLDAELETRCDTAGNDLKVFLGGDSFTFTVMPFMRIAYGNVYTRYAMPPLTTEVLEGFDPDIVVYVNWGANVPSGYYDNPLE